MVLSGTLREFILADVCQLLTQQKITGKLILNNGRSEGIIVFKNGLIVSAEKDEEKLSLKLLNYLTKFKQRPSEKINDFFSSYEADFHKLTMDIVSHGIISKEIMRSFSETVTEDITCSLFLWHTGSYRFASLRSVDQMVPLNISFPVENIVMEAMRRIDEWHRMVSIISHDMIFVKSNKNEWPDNSLSPDPVRDPIEHIFHQIDGTSPVFELIQNSCLTEYKVFEALNSLIQEKRIFTLSNKYSKSVQAAILKKEKEKATPPFLLLSSILTTLGIILTILLIAWFVLNEKHSLKKPSQKHFVINHKTETFFNNTYLYDFK